MKKQTKSLVDELCPFCKGAPRRHLPKGIKILCPKCGGSGRKISVFEVKKETK